LFRCVCVWKAGIVPAYRGIANVTTILGTIVACAAILIALLADLLIDESPMIMFALGALAITIGVLAMPMGVTEKKGSDRGFR
jgi:hypothetical protein